ncbi:MAG TPA: hypothetical protein VKA84_04550 [Gemmatimonadaceae bacterium]|nr:hypothetical protein [Gemmatimonadaceae bacterium]
MLRYRTIDRVVTAGLGLATAGLGGWVILSALAPAGGAERERLYLGAGLLGAGAFLVAPAAVTRLVRLAAGVLLLGPRRGGDGAAPPRR